MELEGDSATLCEIFTDRLGRHDRHSSEMGVLRIPREFETRTLKLTVRGCIHVTTTPLLTDVISEWSKTLKVEAETWCSDVRARMNSDIARHQRRMERMFNRCRLPVIARKYL